MSEYQYYEWQAIDRPLTSQERAAVNKLSSHITVTSSGAWVDYSWGDFKHDPKKVLASYFDAYLYLANWGSKHLAFRFPADLLDPRSFSRYIVEPYIELETIGEYLILSLELDEEEPSEDWIESQGQLAALASLRNDILRGDYRTLYLAWLRAVELYTGIEIAEDEPEPPVPPGLNQLNAGLQAFVDLFDIDAHLISAAAQASDETQREPNIDLQAAIGRLPRAECDAFLLRLVQDEPHLALTLRRRLQDLLGIAGNQPTPPQRRVADLLAMQAEWAKAEKRRQTEAARRRHLQEMTELAKRETDIWQAVERLIETSQSKAYDEATQHLTKLRELAEHQGKQAAFQTRVNALTERYRRRSGLLNRFRKSGLI